MIKNYFIEQGEGAPLILLHGNGESGEIFKNQIKAFSRSFRVIVPDTRGHGKTPRGEKPFILGQFADDLNAFMEDLKLDKAHILGFSDGGNIAILFALKYPQKVDKLILNGANFNVEGLSKWFLFTTRIKYKNALKKADKSEKNKRKCEMLSLMVNEPNVTEDELKSIKAPTLVIAGTRDLIKKSHTKELARLIPDSRLRFIRGNHAVARVNPREYNREVLDFLNK